MVFVIKYRRGLLNHTLHALVRATATGVRRDFEGQLLATGGKDDHFHLLVAYPPKGTLSQLVNSLKGVPARKLRNAHHDELTRKLWSRSFWAPSYCAVSGAPLDTVRAYIDQQRQQANREA